jgi:adenine phosphoribosyltransferase
MEPEHTPRWRALSVNLDPESGGRHEYRQAGYHLPGHSRNPTVDRLQKKIRDIPDFPKPGILFKDITPLVKDPATLRLAVHQLLHPFLGERLTAVAGMEARGFIFGSLVAWELGVGFIPLRKPGKLPYDVQSTSYDLEYGSAALEVHIDALDASDRVLLIDDLLATGGTAAASCDLIEKLGAEVAACAFVVELDFLKGRERLANRRVHSLIHY